MLDASLWLRMLGERCAACGGAGAGGFCAGCAAGFRLVRDPCALCGLPLPVATCPRSPAGWHLAGMVAPFRYADPLTHYLHALKFRRARRLGRPLGGLLAAAVRARGQALPDALVPVPLHHRRRIERGYDQAFELARAAARALQLRVITRGVLRSRASAPQTALSLADRHANVTGAFAVRGRFAGLRIALVDDVITTGATVNALARALLVAGATQVEAWAVARTLPGEPDQPRNR
jgi:ComF family protein